MLSIRYNSGQCFIYFNSVEVEAFTIMFTEFKIQNSKYRIRIQAAKSSLYQANTIMKINTRAAIFSVRYLQLYICQLATYKHSFIQQNKTQIVYLLQFIILSPKGTMQNQQSLSIVQVQERIPKQLIETYNNLFKNTQNGKQSSLHRLKHIMINARGNLSQLLQGSFMKNLRQSSGLNYYKRKSALIQLLIKLSEQFKLNAKLLIQTKILMKSSGHSSKFHTDQTKGKARTQQIPFVTYLIKQIQSTFYKSQLNGQTILYRKKLSQLYFLIVSQNIVPVTHLQSITQLLCDRYYQRQLSLELIQSSFRLILAGIQERNIHPHLYFIQNSAVNAVKIPFNNSKWVFNKGMTVWTWFQTHSLPSEQTIKQTCTLFALKTDLGNLIKVRLLSNLDIQVSSFIGNKQVQTQTIPSSQHQIRLNAITMMGVQLQVLEGGFLKSNAYSLNIRVNGSSYKQMIISADKMPKFTSSDIITDFVLFDKFIGKVYSIVISNKNQLNAYERLSTCYSNYGVCTQPHVWALVDSNILKKENIIGIFNAQRSFQGTLINYMGQKNLAYFSGLVSKEKYNQQDYRIVDVLMPFLYFLVVNSKTQKQNYQQLFDAILNQVIRIISAQEKQEDFIPSEDTLFILYFLELSRYSISQPTLNCLLDEVESSNQTSNFYFQLIGKYMDIPLLLQKGLSVQNAQSQLQDLNPVKKTQMMFLLESQWQKKWITQFQGYSSWWSPTFFKYQNDQQFNSKRFQYNENKENRIEWQVKNFITNDFCKCILAPVFKIPQYADMRKYQMQYLGKQCNTEQFSLQLGVLKKGRKMTVKKYLVSTLDRMKKKILGTKQLKSKQTLPSQKTISLTKKKSFKTQIMTECLFIDLLTVVISTVKISKQGFITITSKHSSKAFDHMCVKAFTNKSLLYFTFYFREISFIRKRRFNQSMNTLQIRLKSGQIYLIYFYLKNVDQFISILEEHVQIRKDPYSSYLDSKQPFKWIDKQMSNFQYIQWLNDVAGRNFLDIAQYPVLPWVFVADAKEQKKQQGVYRDLMKNMGSHGSQERIQHFLEKYSSNNQQELFNQYHFGTHYSSSAIIFNYLIRVRPFSIGSLTLQSGKFDCADRIFGSYVGSWRNATNSATDIRELIPQVYTLPEMFLNVNNYDFGQTQDKLRIDNVQLPKWAGKNPYKFIVTVRKQLESDYTSQNINHWIDLIFGYKQRGQAAIQHMNIFFPLTYEDSINLDTVEDPGERLSFQTQIAHFGQIPSQIIGNNPHPIRIKGKTAWQGRLFSDAGQGLLIQKCNLESKSKFTNKDQKFLYNSIFQSKNSIMSIKFLDDLHFIAIRKDHYFIFKILPKKSQFISKQQQVSYQLQTAQISINYKQLGHYVPSTAIGNNLVAVGGFFNGYVHLLFTQQPKCNQAVRFQGLNTITAIQYAQSYQLLYLGDNEGYLKVYQVNFCASNAKNSNSNSTNTKQVQFVEIKSMRLHDSQINSVCLNEKANLVATCSKDGFIKLLNLYSQQLVRMYRNPEYQLGSANNSVMFCQISISPLYSVCFLSEKSRSIYSYSLNGQFMASFAYQKNQKHMTQQKQKPLKHFLYNLSVVPSSDTTQRLTFLTSAKDLFVLELPFLEQKRKIKLKKDQNKMSCFEGCQNGRICLTGTEDGGVQIIADPACY